MSKFLNGQNRQKSMLNFSEEEDNLIRKSCGYKGWVAYVASVVKRHRQAIRERARELGLVVERASTEGCMTTVDIYEALSSGNGLTAEQIQAKTGHLLEVVQKTLPYLEKGRMARHDGDLWYKKYEKEPDKEDRRLARMEYHKKRRKQQGQRVTKKLPNLH